MMLTASVGADIPACSMSSFRLLALLLLALYLFHGADAGQWKGVEVWILILFAEYPATLRTIPPLDSGKLEDRVAKAARSSRRLLSASLK
jgi:hypothetical protein